MTTIFDFFRSAPAWAINHPMVGIGLMALFLVLVLAVTREISRVRDMDGS
jgi:hypothetical protein